MARLKGSSKRALKEAQGKLEESSKECLKQARRKLEAKRDESPQGASRKLGDRYKLAERNRKESSKRSLRRMSGKLKRSNHTISPQISLSPTGWSYSICLYFCWARSRSQRLFQALASNFPSKMPDLDAYLPSYGQFRRFWKV